MEEYLNLQAQHEEEMSRIRLQLQAQHEEEVRSKCKKQKKTTERDQHESEEEKEENREEAKYIIERIVEMTVQNGQKSFLIKWEGYEERAWVPDTNLDKEMHANRNKKRFVLHLTIKFIFNTTLAYGRSSYEIETCYCSSCVKK